MRKISFCEIWGIWSLFSRTPIRISSQLFHTYTTYYICSSWKVWKRIQYIICLKLFRYKVFVNWKLKLLNFLMNSVWLASSSETQGQIVGARESLIGRKNMPRRKVKNGEKSPWGQCLTRPVPNGRRRSAFWLGRKTQKFSGTNQKWERRGPFGTGLIRHCPQGLFSPFFAFLRALFSRPFRLSLALTICPWVSEDGGNRFWFELSEVDCMFKTRYSKG